MRVSIRSGITTVFNALILLIFIYLLAKPNLAIIPITESIYLCVKVIVPALFIYMVLARLVISMPFTTVLCNKLDRYGVEAEVFLLGILCGFPVGAKSAVYLYNSGTISKKRAEYLCAFTNNASLSFLLGYIGTSLFSDIKIGIRLAIFQFISSLITAIILRLVFMKKEDFQNVKSVNMVPQKRPSVSDAVTDTAYTMLSVCAFIITFSVIGELAVAVLKPEGFIKVLIKGFFEFSSGIASAASLEPDVAFFTISIAVGFSGLCVIMQVISVIRGVLSPKMYVLGRFLSMAVFGLLSIFFGMS
ncbi:MAG TPA: hypothetical protein DCP51_03610 [Clostridiales bacterium]|nr:hypothetical protein [Clostridiales bacterium]